MLKKRHTQLLFWGLFLPFLLLLFYSNCSRPGFQYVEQSESQNSLTSLIDSEQPSDPSPPFIPEVPVNLAKLRDAPASIELEDWTSGEGVVAGRINLNNRLPNLSFDDQALQNQFGQVVILNSSDSILWKGFEFGGIAFISANLGEGDKPLYQVLFGAKPSGRWNSYPFADTFNAKTDLTIPPAFKVVIRDNNNQIIGRLQMRDGKPINDPSLSQIRTDKQALRPFFNIGMLLPWSNTRPKLNQYMKNNFPGFQLPRESQAKSVFSANAAIPLLAIGADGRSQGNGLNNWSYLPQWPQPTSTTTAQDPNLDPYIGDPDRFYTGDLSYQRSFRATGWDYEPGSVSGHDWFTGPGGVRFDRSPIPAPMAYLISEQNYKRAKDQKPITEMAYSWGLGYFNHSTHYLTDVKNFSGIIDVEADPMGYSFMNAYYGRGPFVGLNKSIDIRAIGNGDYRESNGNGGTPDHFFLDKNGNRFWGGYAVDDHHGHQTPYWHVLAMNSPMHIVASRSAFVGALLGRLNWHHTTIRPVNNWDTGASYATFNTRVQAWRWLHYSMAYKIGSSHPLSVSRETALRLFKEDLHHYHDNILLPVQNENKNPYHVAIKNLGMPVEPSQEQGRWVLKLSSAIAFYHAPVFLMMKKFGLWDELRKDPKCKASLDFVFNSLSKYSIDFILDTHGRAEGEDGTTAVTLPNSNFNAITSADLPKSWADWAKKFPAQGKEDWLRRADGSHLERYAAQHIRAQWAIMVRDWFPEMNYPRAAQGAAAYENFYAEKDRLVKSLVSPFEQSANDFSFQMISYGPIRGPQK